MRGRFRWRSRSWETKQRLSAHHRVAKVVFWSTVNVSSPTFIKDFINGSIVLLQSPLAAGYGRLDRVQKPDDPVWAYQWLKDNGAVGVINVMGANVGGLHDTFVDDWVRFQLRAISGHITDQ